MADPQQSEQELDTISHPVLGPLRFPKDMGPNERNAIIDEHLAQHKQQMEQQGSGSIAPKLDSVGAATEFGLREFGGGVKDVGKGMWDTLAKPPEGKVEKTVGAISPIGVPAMRMAKGLYGLGQQAMQVPGAIKDLYNSPDPMGTLALTAPRVGGQIAGTMLASEAPKIAQGGIDNGIRGLRTARDVTPVINRVTNAWEKNAPDELAFQKEMKSPERVQAMRDYKLAATSPERMALRTARMRGETAPGAAGSMVESVVNPEEIPGSAARGFGRMVLTPEELMIEARNLQMAQRMARQRGMQFAGGMVPAEGRSVPMRPRPTMTEEWRGVKPESEQ